MTPSLTTAETEVKESLVFAGKPVVGGVIINDAVITHIQLAVPMVWLSEN